MSTKLGRHYALIGTVLPLLVLLLFYPVGSIVRDVLYTVSAGSALWYTFTLAVAYESKLWVSFAAIVATLITLKGVGWLNISLAMFGF